MCSLVLKGKGELLHHEVQKYVTAAPLSGGWMLNFHVTHCLCWGEHAVASRSCLRRRPAQEHSLARWPGVPYLREGIVGLRQEQPSPRRRPALGATEHLVFGEFLLKLAAGLRGTPHRKLLFLQFIWWQGCVGQKKHTIFCFI